MQRGKMTKLGEFYLAPGYSTEYMVVGHGTEWHYDPLRSDEDEFITLIPVTIEQAYRYARNGKLQDGKSLASVYFCTTPPANLTRKVTNSGSSYRSWVDCQIG